MIPRHAARSRSWAVASAVLVTLATLAGCSSRPHEILGPSSPTSTGFTAAAEPSLVLAPPHPVSKWKEPRIVVRTEGWTRVQKDLGVSLDPSGFFDLEVPEQEPVTFRWSATAMSPRGEITAYRWVVDIEGQNILDETPRSGPSDVTHWSEWSAAVTSATVGPFDAGTHFFYVEARDNLGYMSLVTVRLQVGPASAEGAQGLIPTRRGG